MEMMVRTHPARPKALIAWLFAVAALVFLMVVVGGITRLTESGLSITEWRPLTGVLPPLSQAGWEAEFAKYRQIPEYREVNAGMSLAAFKVIYFWEWFHRLLGRVVGLAFALPFAWFLWTRAVPRGYARRLAALLLLGGLQGAIGWWMVTSGLVDRVDVSHVRLSVHLSVAFLILGGLIWTALDLLRGGMHRAQLTAVASLALIGLAGQVVLGAWMAGLDAGQVASTWPDMNGRLFPDGVAWAGAATFVEDPFLVHFLHRWWAFGAAALLVWLAAKARAAGDRTASRALFGALGLQLLLGIWTVVAGVPMALAALHQAVGALLVAATAWAAHSAGLRYRVTPG